MTQPKRADEFGPTTFTGKGVDMFKALLLANALGFYAKTKMKVNSAYTPANMMKAAARITGKTFRARDYSGAAEALRTHANALKESAQ